MSSEDDHANHRQLHFPHFLSRFEKTMQATSPRTVHLLLHDLNTCSDA